MKRKLIRTARTICVNFSSCGEWILVFYALRMCVVWKMFPLCYLSRGVCSSIANLFYNCSKEISAGRANH